MLSNQSLLNQSTFHSVIGQSSVIHPESGNRKRSIMAELLLTALIDAFSILVIFLLMSFSSTGEILYIGKGMELPKAALGELLDRTPIVKVNDGKYFLEEKEYTADGLTEAFLELRKQFKEARPNEEFPGILTVQADRREKYEQLNAVVLAASQAGISDIKFAIIMK